MARKLTVLVIDDTAAHRKLYSSWLRVGGYTPRVLADERNALDLVRETRPDAIIVDVLMSRLSGLDVIETLKANVDTAAVPVMALTVLDNRASEDAAFAAGADAFLSKQVGLEDFLAKIADLCNLTVRA